VFCEILKIPINLKRKLEAAKFSDNGTHRPFRFLALITIMFPVTDPLPDCFARFYDLIEFLHSRISNTVTFWCLRLRWKETKSISANSSSRSSNESNAQGAAVLFYGFMMLLILRIRSSEQRMNTALFRWEYISNASGCDYKGQGVSWYFNDLPCLFFLGSIAKCQGLNSQLLMDVRLQKHLKFVNLEPVLERALRMA